MMMDICHLKKKEIYELDIIEYNEMLNYAVTTYRMRVSAMLDPKGSTSGTNQFFFQQPPDFDVDPKCDPNFVSKV